MAEKTITQNPSITDEVVFDILTPNEVLVSGEQPECFSADPYKVDSITIYYVHRNFSKAAYGTAEIETTDSSLEEELDYYRSVACDAPTDENISKVLRTKERIKASAKKDKLYFNEANVVAQIGTDDFPAWLSTDQDNALIEHITEDEDGNTIYGKFKLRWKPLGMREGDYFICWTWTPLPAGEKYSAHLTFSLRGNTQVTTSIPTHFTDPEKYNTLLERYLPEMFKMTLSDNDLTPRVLDQMNVAMGDGFTFLEDMANQMVDLLDSNSTHESLLATLGNLYNLKLRTGDPTLWRRQIKSAIPLFKKKGTLTGLKEALSQAGITLSQFTRLWQVVSKYTYQEVFTVSDGETNFELSELAILPIDPNNFELYHRASDSDDWTQLTSDYVSVVNVDGVSTMTWVGDELSIAPIILQDGDAIRVLYQIAEVPNSSEQEIEDYVRTLTLSDQRDDRDQSYPLKNWNVRLIEEDDAMFDLVVSTLHPFYDPLIYGKVRTEFPYSENAYNMEEYNGSTRDSTEPCDIDADFLDPCSSCISSKFNVDLEIENLSNDRILEANEIIEEFVPFHARLHSMNLYGGINEFIQSPIEQITMLLSYNGEEITLTDAQTIFSRSMTSLEQFRRDALANVSTVVSSASGTAKNSEIVLFSPDVRLDELGIDQTDTLTHLEILSGSHQGDYTVENANKNHAKVAASSPTTPSEPLSESSFTFRLSNEKARKASSTTITQDDYYTLTDTEINFSLIGVKTQWDVDNDEDYDGSAWTITFDAYGGPITIQNILPNGAMVLPDYVGLPTTSVSGLSYSLSNGSTTYDSITGALGIKRRATVDLSGTILVRGNSTSSLEDVRNIIEVGDYVYIEDEDEQFKVTGFVDGETHQFYIDSYTSGTTVTANDVIVYKRLVDSGIGYLNYKGLELETLVDHETGLGILNGTNAPIDDDDILDNDQFKENFLLLIDSNYYAISEINGTTITLAGPHIAWTTSGTAITYDIMKYSKFTGTSINPPDGMRYDPIAEISERSYPPVAGHSFESVDRSGNRVITISTNTEVSGLSISSLLNKTKQKDQIVDTVSQEESISFTIQYTDGTQRKGEI